MAQIDFVLVEPLLMQAHPSPQKLDRSRGNQMRFKKQICALVVALFSLQTLQFTARADEGMWAFNNLPRAEIKKKYGFDVTDEWMEKVQSGSVRFNSGGSGSFVSADGLVMTNHHIASDVLQKISTPEKDYIKDRSEEHTSELQSLAYLVCRLL